MKLYATTTSERASKGQGGNDYLIIDVSGEDQEIFLSIIIKDIVSNTGEYQYTGIGITRKEKNRIVEHVEMKTGKKLQTADYICPIEKHKQDAFLNGIE